MKDSPIVSSFRSFRPRSRLGRALERWSRSVAQAAGSSWGFGLSVAVVILWALTGPLFNFSNSWQLVINTGTTIITFLMVFLIQRAQNKDALAIHLKLNELVAAVKGASNRLIDVESLSEADLNQLRKYYAQLVQMAKHDLDLGSSHSVEEAERRHHAKRASESARPG